MAKKYKYTYKEIGGTSQNEKNGISYVKNMINEGSINVKRRGHINVAKITDIDLKPLKINGIYSYSQIENGEGQEYKIVHAKNKLFKCKNDFSSYEEIESSSLINDSKSQALPVGNSLFIVGCGELLLYDGVELKSAYGDKKAYIPTTAFGITDITQPDKRVVGEEQNLLTPRRINRLRGTQKAPSVFLLDSNVRYGTKLILEVKIRTVTSSQEEEYQNATSYIGIDKDGNEVSTIATIRYEVSSVSDGSSFFVTEPIKDIDGNEISIKRGDKTYLYNQLPFGVSIKNHKEVHLSFETTPPFEDEDNITVEYESTNEDTGDKLSNATHLALSNSDNGKAIFVACFGDNKLYFSDKDKGIYHMPQGNEISLGSESEPITAVIRLSDNMIGVFKKNSFYRVRFTSSNENGYEVFFSTDQVGAINQGSACVVNNECLVFNERGIYSASDYRSGENAFSLLKECSPDIRAYLSHHTKEEIKNALAISVDKKHYLFIGENVYITDTDSRVRKSTASNYSYELWVWDFMTVTSVYADGDDIYFGLENGEIRKFSDKYYDTDLVYYKTDENSLLLKQEENATGFVLGGLYEGRGKMIKITLSDHEVLITREAEYKNGELCLADGFLYKDGTPKIYDGMTITLYDKYGTQISSGTVASTNIVNRSVTIDHPLTEGEVYVAYLKEDDSFEYDIESTTSCKYLLRNGERITIRTQEPLTLTQHRRENVVCEYKTIPLCFDKPTTKKTLKNVYLKIPKWSKGKINLELETKRGKLKREINLGNPIDFDSLDFDSISFNSELDIIVRVKAFMRGFEYLTLKITSSDGKQFGLDTIYFEYTEEK